MVLAYIGFAGICLIIQAIHIFQSGVAAPFFLANIGRQPLPKVNRFLNGSLYLIVGAGLTIFVAVVLARRGVGIHSSNIEGALVLGASGILFLIRPDIVIRWAKHSDPNISQTTRSLIGARIIAALLLFGGLLFLTFAQTS